MNLVLTIKWTIISYKIYIFTGTRYEVVGYIFLRLKYTPWKGSLWGFCMPFVHAMGPLVTLNW